MPSRSDIGISLENLDDNMFTDKNFLPASASNKNLSISEFVKYFNQRRLDHIGIENSISISRKNS